MKKRILHWMLRGAKAAGLFRLARRLTRGDLRILCYHGAALDDESNFSPGLFMTRGTFATRMRYLSDNDFPIIGLDAALDGLQRNELPRCATVITIDDGWLGTYRIMAPVLRNLDFPATFYVASYYAGKQTQVFDVAVGYVLWKARDRVLDIGAVSGQLTGTYALADHDQRSAATHELLAHGASMGRDSDRQRLLERLCAHLNVDWREIRQQRLIAFVNGEELNELAGMGIDVQLHTHRHRFPEDSRETAVAEIEDNRNALAGSCPGPFLHFCYPSGVYSRLQWPWLASLGIRSATTTRGGFNRTDQHPYELRRFLDSERVSSLEFEAEMTGLFELVRRFGYRI